MKKYEFDSEQISKILDETINLFLDYQFTKGYDESRARIEAMMDVLRRLERASGAADEKSGD